METGNLLRDIIWATLIKPSSKTLLFPDLLSNRLRNSVVKADVRFFWDARRAKKELVEADNKRLAPEVDTIVLAFADRNDLLMFDPIVHKFPSSTMLGELRPILIVMTIWKSPLDSESQNRASDINLLGDSEKPVSTTSEGSLRVSSPSRGFLDFFSFR